MTHILLVEDSDDHAQIITKVLTATKGWKVTRAMTVKEALLHAALKPLDVAIVDYRLPDGDGIDLMDTLRAQKPGLPIVFLTAHGSEEVAMQAMSRGAADYVVKGPHYQKELTGRIAEVLGRAEDIARMGAAVKHSKDAAPARGEAAKQGGGGLDPKALGPVVKGLCGGEVQGAAVFDGHGKALASKLPAGVDAAALGAALVGTQFQAQHALRQIPNAGPPRVVLLEFESGLLGMAAVPGPALVTLLFDGAADRTEAVRRVRDAAQQVWNATRA